MAAASRCLAIDFGTCYSSAARMIGDRPEAVKDPIGHVYSTPSTVLRNRRGELVVGFLAERQKRGRAGEYAQEFKRVLGRQPVILGEDAVPAESLVAEVLRFVKAEAEATDGPYERGVVTVPASYEAGRRELMQQAAREAGFAKVELVDEPIAAAMARHHDAGRDEVVLVYDLGGGTFDAALVRFLADGGHDVLAPSGIDSIGGANFDRAIERDLSDQAGAALKDALAGLRSDDRSEWIAAKQVQLLARDFCEDIKRELSRLTRTENTLVFNGHAIDYELSRERFERLIDDDLAATVDCCDKLVRDTKLRWEDVDAIVMVGGSCRLPFIGERLARSFGRPLEAVIDPELAVCLGAAVLVEREAEQKRRRAAAERERKRRAQEERERIAAEEARRKLEAQKAEAERKRTLQRAKAAREARQRKQEKAARTAANKAKLGRIDQWNSMDSDARDDLRSMLDLAEEDVEAAFECKAMNVAELPNSGLVLTSQRVLWAHTTVFGNHYKGVIPIAGVTEVSVVPGSGPTARITITHASGTARFGYLRTDEAKRIKRFITSRSWRLT